MRLFSEDDDTYRDNYWTREANRQRDMEKTRADEATDILRTLVQLKLMKNIEPEFYVKHKEEVWKIAEEFLAKDYIDRESLGYYRTFLSSSSEVRDEYRSHYERFFGPGD